MYLLFQNFSYSFVYSGETLQDDLTAWQIAENDGFGDIVTLFGSILIKPIIAFLIILSNSYKRTSCKGNLRDSLYHQKSPSQRNEGIDYPNYVLDLEGS